MRVDLPFPLVHARLHIGDVAGPFSALVLFLIECIGIRVDADALELAQDHAGEEVLQLGVLIDQQQIRPYLSAGIAEPHRMDVSGIDEGVVISDRMDRRVKRVGETIGEHPGQPFVLQKFHDLLNLGLDGFGDEESFIFRRTSRLMLFRMADCNGSDAGNQDKRNRSFHHSVKCVKLVAIIVIYPLFGCLIL